MNRISLVLLVLAGSALAAETKPLHPIVKPYEGSKIWSDLQTWEYAEYDLPTGPLEKGKLRRTTVTGKVSRIAYRTEGRSLLELYENYKQALKKAGFEIVFDCKGYAECGHNGLVKYLYNLPGSEGGRYFVGKQKGPNGPVWVAMNVENNSNVHVVSIESKEMEKDKVVVTMEELQSDLERTGHVAVYGILFDTGKATLKPESTPALVEVSKLFAKNPKLKLYVVGHTDNEGTLAANLDLSKRRADAVVKALVTDHKIPAANLAAHGVASLVPVATNKANDGRAQNRRVELVEQ